MMWSKPGRVAGALLLTSAFACGALELGATLVARARLAAIVADNPNLAVAGISANPFAGRVTLRDVAFAQGPWHVRIGALRLPFALPAELPGLFASEASASPFSDKPSPPPAGASPRRSPG